MPSRRLHCKNRHGCVGCKGRRVKVCCGVFFGCGLNCCFVSGFLGGVRISEGGVLC